ncbi:MAG: response regulator [Pleurocapsa minor HA4230-MV1]|jgi:twitching motility two-component system response regulator PilG|nr:response regulator [Pleurocapsa minor HA4230-MV1]
MSAKKYNPNQLISILDSLFKKNSSGILSLKTQVDSWQQQRSCILILRNGALVYGGNQVPNAEELCFKIGQALKPNLIKAALSVAVEKAKEPNSAVELLEMLIRMRAFTWQEVESLVNTKVLLIIEKFLPYPGEAQWNTDLDLDLSYGADRHGLNWVDLQQELKRRQQIWQDYAPQISSMNVIPVFTPQQLRAIDNPQVKDHFTKLVDGRASLLNIADKMGKDPITVAKNYFNWANKDWVSFVDSPIEAKTDVAAIANMQGSVPGVSTSVDSTEAIAKIDHNLPIVLSVDDSAIIQTSIKRALQEDYNVLLAGKAKEALDILQEVKVELMLLDLTMPDVDGLEFCKTVRAIPQFRDLPIVMVTARDGLVNKMRGHIAGTSKYLTKPFKPEELREVVRQYIK